MALRLVLLTAIAATLAVPTAATAGGWATVGFDPPPDDLAAGQPWQVDLTILQHGRTPLEGVKPVVHVEEEAGDGQASFPARPTDELGVYRATVVFKSRGAWTLAIDDGFSATHRFPAVEVGDGSAAASATVASTADVAPPAAGGGDGPDYLLALVAAAVAALVAGLAAALVQRRGGGASPASG